MTTFSRTRPAMTRAEAEHIVAVTTGGESSVRRMDDGDLAAVIQCAEDAGARFDLRPAKWSPLLRPLASTDD